ncbi:hypothetical protein C7M84_025205 [Penaeus vannamei]|uniref:Uncharacterized protein n=1 Tax=Penaeus vannamei TaxID=6689 RepID=A0A423TYT3_PENVA|nr:hypothetical protein C7M84_025205 [Penaeus vannamei]
MGNGTYEFGYDTRGGRTGARFFRHEEKGVDGRVRGQYGFVDANDDLHVILYVTDALGHRIRTETHKIEGYGRELSRMLEQASSSADVKDQINILLEKRKSNPTVTTSSTSSTSTSTSTVASTDPPATTTQTFRTTRGTNLFSDFEPYFSDEDPPATTIRPTLRSLLRSTAFTSSSIRHSTPRPFDRDLSSASVLTRPPTSRDSLRESLDYDDVDRLVSLLDNARSRTTTHPRLRDFSTPATFSGRDDFTSAPSSRPSTLEELRELARSTQSPRRERPDDAGTARPSEASLLPLALGIPVPLRKSLSEDQSDKLRNYLSRILRGDGGESGAIVLGRLNANAFRGSKMSDVLRSLGLIQSDFDDVIRGSNGDPLAVYFDPTAGRETQGQKISNNRANSKPVNEGIIDGGIIDGGIIDGGIVDGGIIGDGGRGFLRGSITSRPLNGDTGGKNLGGEIIDGGIVDGGIIGGSRDDGFIDGGIIDGGIIGGRISTRGKSGRGFNSGDIIDGGIIDGGIIDDRRVDNFNNGRRGKTIDQPSARDFASQPRGSTSQQYGNAKSLLTPPPTRPSSRRPSSRRPSSAGGSSKTSLLDQASLIDQLIAFHKPEYPEGFKEREAFNNPSEASRQRGLSQGSGQNGNQINSRTQTTQPAQGKQIAETQSQVEGPVRMPEVLHYIPSPDLSTGRPSDYQVPAAPRPSENLGKSSESVEVTPPNTEQKSNDNRNPSAVNLVSPADDNFGVRPVSVSSLSPNRSPVFINSTVYFTTTAIPDILHSNLIRPRLRQSGQSLFAKELRQESDSSSDESGEQKTDRDLGRTNNRISQPVNSLDIETSNARERPREGQGIGTASLGSSGHIPSKIDTIVLPAFFDTTPQPLPSTPKTTRPTTTAPTLKRPPPTTQQTTRQLVPTAPSGPPSASLRGTNRGRLSHFPVNSREQGAFRRIVPTNAPPTQFPTTTLRGTTLSRFQSLRKPPRVTTLPPIHLPTTAVHPTTTAITQVFSRPIIGTPDSFFPTASAEVSSNGRALNSKPPPIVVNNPPIHLTTVLPPSVALLRSPQGLPRVRPEDVVPILHHGPPLIPTLRGPTFPHSRVRSYRLGSGSIHSR